MDAVLQTVLFLELSEAEIVDDDAAIGMMEGIASALQRLGPAELKHFKEYLQRQASEMEPSEERDFIQDMPSVLGLEP